MFTFPSSGVRIDLQKTITTKYKSLRAKKRKVELNWWALPVVLRLVNVICSKYKANSTVKEWEGGGCTRNESATVGLGEGQGSINGKLTMKSRVGLFNIIAII